MYAHNVSVPNLCGRSCLRIEPFHLFRRCQVARKNHLNRDDPIETLLPRSVDNTHPASAQFVEQFIIAKLLNHDVFELAARLAIGGRTGLGLFIVDVRTGRQYVIGGWVQAFDGIEALDRRCQFGMHLEEPLAVWRAAGVQLFEIEIQQVKRAVVFGGVCPVRHG
jgi:hypothetical protein